MRILLDISTLGAAENPHQRGTLGIFRVVEHTVLALTEAPDCEPYFCARQNIAAARRYYEKHIKLLAPDRAKFVNPYFLTHTITEVLIEVEDYLAKHYVHAPWRWLANGRILWKAVRFLLRNVEPNSVQGLEVYHSPADDLPHWTKSIKKLTRFETVHDLIPEIHPEYYPPSTTRRARRALETITFADWSLCVSQSTRQDLLRRYPNCDPAKTIVVYLGAEKVFHPVTDAIEIDAVRQRYGLQANTSYFLSVSVLEPRKNFGTIIRAFAHFARTNPENRTCLVLVGTKGWNTESIVEALNEQGVDHRARVVFAGYVPDSDLAALYSGALAFVYMSLYEGFGLPPLEAMQCGTPVIASNTSSLPEVVGAAGILLSPTDQTGLAEAMCRISDDPALRQKLAAAALERASHFSWSQYRRELCAAYRKAADQQKKPAVVV